MYRLPQFEGQRQWNGKVTLAGFPSGLSPIIQPGPGSEIKSMQQVGAEERALD